MANQNERPKELLRNTTQGSARKPDAEESGGDAIDTATRDALTKDTDASRLLQLTVDETGNMTARLLTAVTWNL